jgi:hypothetical protein
MRGNVSEPSRSSKFLSCLVTSLFCWCYSPSKFYFSGVSLNYDRRKWDATGTVVPELTVLPRVNSNFIVVPHRTTVDIIRHLPYRANPRTPQRPCSMYILGMLCKVDYVLHVCKIFNKELYILALVGIA